MYFLHVLRPIYKSTPHLEKSRWLIMRDLCNMAIITYMWWNVWKINSCLKFGKRFIKTRWHAVCGENWNYSLSREVWSGLAMIHDEENPLGFCFMMMSSNGNIFRVTGHLCGEFAGPRFYSPHKGQWRGALMFSLICARINGRVNNGETGDFGRHRAHYDAISPTYILVTYIG